MRKSLRDRNRKPTHPGALLREDVLPALNMTQAEFAKRLGVSRLSVSELLNERRALSPEMAARLGRLLKTARVELKKPGEFAHSSGLGIHTVIEAPNEQGRL